MKFLYIRSSWGIALLFIGEFLFIIIIIFLQICFSGGFFDIDIDICLYVWNFTKTLLLFKFF